MQELSWLLEGMIQVIPGISRMVGLLPNTSGRGCTISFEVVSVWLPVLPESTWRKEVTSVPEAILCGPGVIQSKP